MSISNIDAQKSDFKKYENTDYNVTIDYPSKWKKSENNLAQNQIVIFSAPEVEQKESSVLSFIFIPAKVALASQQTPSSNMTLENFTNYFIDNGYSSPDEYKIIKTSRTTLAGNEAVELLMYEYVGDKTSKVKRVISLFDNDTAYMIKYAAEPGKFSKYLPIAQQIIDSFQPTTFLKNNIPVANEPTEEKKNPIEIPTTKSKKSYQLIIYLDNASPQNAIGDNFKILVYNSNNEPILSTKPNIDFDDDHQKISPPKGYPIIYQSGQYPKDIKVCAQQEYPLNGTTKLHDDCYPIKQNVQKTYWYTIFDYGEIDGFEADSNSIAKSNEMTPTTDTITPDNKTESNNQDAGNIGQDQGNEVTVTIVQGSADAGSGENKYNGSSHTGYGFDPPELVILKGTIVKWVNNDSTIHTVTSGKPSSNIPGTAFDSSYLNAGESYLHKFNKKGTYDYYCTLYPFMKGKIIVGDTDSSSSDNQRSEAGSEILENTDKAADEISKDANKALDKID